MVPLPTFYADYEIKLFNVDSDGAKIGEAIYTAWGLLPENEDTDTLPTPESADFEGGPATYLVPLEDNEDWTLLYPGMVLEARYYFDTNPDSYHLVGIQPNRRIHLLQLNVRRDR